MESAAKKAPFMEPFLFAFNARSIVSGHVVITHSGDGALLEIH